MLYTADFETIRDRPDDENAARVWAWAACPIQNSNEVTYGTEVKTFIEWIGEHPGLYYFHNLRYDGRYIVDYLFKAGWTFTPTQPKRTKHFTCMISRLGQWCIKRAILHWIA